MYPFFFNKFDQEVLTVDKQIFLFVNVKTVSYHTWAKMEHQLTDLTLQHIMSLQIGRCRIDKKNMETNNYKN